MAVLQPACGWLVVGQFGSRAIRFGYKRRPSRSCFPERLGPYRKHRGKRETPGWGGGRAAVLSIRRVEGSLPGLARKIDRKSTRLNSSHLGISYAVFCLKK